MKCLIPNTEILNNLKYQMTKTQNRLVAASVLVFEHLVIRYCLEFRNSNLGFIPERSA